MAQTSLEHMKYLVGLVYLGVGCGGGGTDPGPIAVTTPRATITRVADIANTGTGSDLLISVGPPADESLVAEYRLLVVRQANAAGFDVTAASAVPSGQYTSVARGQASADITLAIDATDVGGDLIAEGVPYVVYVLVVVTTSDVGNQLSGASAAISLARTNLVLTLTASIQAGSGGMAVDADGNIYMADFGAALSAPPGTRVFKITPEGEVSVFATGLVGASGNAFDSKGDLFQSNNGHITFANGVLYVVARSAHRIYQLTLDGELTLLAGTGTRGLWDGAALDARLSLTNDVAVSPDGSILYFNDVVNQTGSDVISPVVIRQLILVP